MSLVSLNSSCCRVDTLSRRKTFLLPGILASRSTRFSYYGIQMSVFSRCHQFRSMEKHPIWISSLCHSLSQKLFAFTSCCAHEKLETTSHLSLSRHGDKKSSEKCLFAYSQRWRGKNVRKILTIEWNEKIIEQKAIHGLFG